MEKRFFDKIKNQSGFARQVPNQGLYSFIFVVNPKKACNYDAFTGGGRINNSFDFFQLLASSFLLKSSNLKMSFKKNKLKFCLFNAIPCLEKRFRIHLKISSSVAALNNPIIKQNTQENYFYLGEI